MTPTRHVSEDGCLQRDHTGYSRRYLSFVAAHREAFDAAYLDGNPQASRPEMERLSREFETLPPRHSCSCWPAHCVECARLARTRVNAPTAVEIGRSGNRAHPPMPLTVCLDIEGGYAA